MQFSFQANWGTGWARVYSSIPSSVRKFYPSRSYLVRPNLPPSSANRAFIWPCESIWELMYDLWAALDPLGRCKGVPEPPGFLGSPPALICGAYGSPLTRRWATTGEASSSQREDLVLPTAYLCQLPRPSREFQHQSGLRSLPQSVDPAAMFPGGT